MALEKFSIISKDCLIFLQKRNISYFGPSPYIIHLLGGYMVIMALNVLTLLINLYINRYTFNHVVMNVDVDSSTCSACFIFHVRGGLFFRVFNPIHLDVQGG